MRDLGEGCEGVGVALDKWIDALELGDADRLHDIFTDDFMLTCDPTIAGGRMNKNELIEVDRLISEASIEILSFTARRYDDTAISQTFAKVNEQFSGDPVGSSVEQLSGIFGSGRTLAYATGWRVGANGEWQVFQHHLFGPID